MKLSTKPMNRALLIFFILFSHPSLLKAQQFLTTTNGWNAYVHLPDDYNTTSKTYPLIVFVPGLGEVGTDPAALLINGPSYFIAKGDKMQFMVNGVLEKPIVISVQPPAAWPNSLAMNKVLDDIVSRWRVDINRISLTGLSMGGWVVGQYISDSKSAYRTRIASVMVMHAATVNNPFSQFDVYAREGGKWWGIEGALDKRKMDQIYSNIIAGSADAGRYNLIPAGQTGATHCCWNTFYDPAWQDNGESIYTWMLKQKRNSSIPAPPLPAPNLPPTASAGPDQTITLPLNTVTLSGSGTDPDGSIVSYAWTKLAGPAAFSMAAATSPSTTVGGLVQGSYQFELRVTDNRGATATDVVTVVVNAAAPAPGCGCTTTLSRMPDGGIYVSGSTIKPGSVVCIPAGNYPYINLREFNGTATNPIIVKNCDGQVVITGKSYGISITKSSHFKLTGTGDPNYTYGFKVDGTASGSTMTSGLGISNQSTDFTADHIEITGTGVGVICKTNPTCDPMTWDGNFTMRNVELHDMYVHNIVGEGFYVGHTASKATITCDNQSISVPTQKIEGLKIYNCKTDATGWDGIQVASVPQNCEVFNNEVRNYGLQNHPSQQQGLLFGGLCNGKVYNNHIEKGTGPGLMILGVGYILAYNNVLIQCGQDGSAQGQDGIYIDDRPSPDYPPLYVHVANNTVVSPGRSGIRLENTNRTILPKNEFLNNLVVNPSSQSATDAYLSIRNGAGHKAAGNSYIAAVNQAGFYNSAASDYRLTDKSPAIDAGSPVSHLGIFKDKNGLERSIGKNPDAGAFEFDNGTPAPAPNLPPTASAGPDQTITLPLNTVTLSGSGTDPDGSIVSYAWTKLAGPAAFSMAAATSPSTTVGGLVQGSYQFELRVTDNRGATATDVVTVVVNAPAPAPNLPPTASAGPDQTITLPLNTVTLSGSGTDPDGIDRLVCLDQTGRSGGL